MIYVTLQPTSFSQTFLWMVLAKNYRFWDFLGKRPIELDLGDAKLQHFRSQWWIRTIQQGSIDYILIDDLQRSKLSLSLESLLVSRVSGLSLFKNAIVFEVYYVARSPVLWSGAVLVTLWFALKLLAGIAPLPGGTNLSQADLKPILDMLPYIITLQLSPLIVVGVALAYFFPLARRAKSGWLTFLNRFDAIVIVVLFSSSVADFSSFKLGDHSLFDPAITWNLVKVYRGKMSKDDLKKRYYQTKDSERSTKQFPSEEPDSIPNTKIQQRPEGR